MLSEYEWMQIFAGNLKSLMEESNMSQRDLAKQTGISESAISKYLSCKCMPSANALINIAYVFPCADFGDLLVFSDDRIEMKPQRRSWRNKLR